MTTTRILPGVVLAVLATAGPAAAQYAMPSYGAPGRSAVPSVLPTGAMEPDDQLGPGGGFPAMPPGRPPAAASLEKMTVPPQRGVPDGADPAARLTPAGPGGLPPGAYASPWYTDGPGCCGPVGRHGPVEYELYFQTGPSFVFGSGEYTDRLNTGWAVNGGGRSLFYNREGDAAWVLDLGLSYQYNRGTPNDLIDLFIRQPSVQNQQTGARVNQPDRLVSSRIRALQRTAFNYSIGRDWWVWGPGQPGAETGWNLRWGTDVGGRWGTAHVDINPNNDPRLYARRQKAYEGVFVGAHANIEVPVGGWIWFGGLRVRWGYDWMNIVPPIKGDVQYIDLLLNTGVRF